MIENVYLTHHISFTIKIVIRLESGIIYFPNELALKLYCRTFLLYIYKRSNLSFDLNNESRRMILWQLFKNYHLLTTVTWLVSLTCVKI